MKRTADAQGIRDTMALLEGRQIVEGVPTGAFDKWQNLFVNKPTSLQQVISSRKALSELEQGDLALLRRLKVIDAAKAFNNNLEMDDQYYLIVDGRLVGLVDNQGYSYPRYIMTFEDDALHDVLQLVKGAKQEAAGDDQVAWYIQKFKDKMSGSGLEATIGWIDGIGKLSDAEKVEVLRGIKGEYESNNGTYGRKAVDNVAKLYKWFKPSMLKEDRQLAEAMMALNDMVIDTVQTHGGGFGLAGHEAFNNGHYLDNQAGTDYAAFAKAAKDGFISGAKASDLNAIDAMVYLNSKAGRWLGDEMVGLFADGRKTKMTPKQYGQAVTDLTAKRAKRDMAAIAKDSPADWNHWAKMARASEKEALAAAAKWTAVGKAAAAARPNPDKIKAELVDTLTKQINSGALKLGAKLFGKEPALSNSLGIVVTLESGDQIRIKVDVSPVK